MAPVVPAAAGATTSAGPAAGAVRGAKVGQAIGQFGPVAGKVGSAALAYIPDATERQLRQYYLGKKRGLFAERAEKRPHGLAAGVNVLTRGLLGRREGGEFERLAGGAGGLTPAQREAAQAAAAGQVQAQVQAAQAELARGTAGAQPSGLQAQAQAELARQAQGAMAQQQSALRAQDLELARQQQAEALSALFTLQQMEQQRRAQALSYLTTGLSPEAAAAQGGAAKTNLLTQLGGALGGLQGGGA